MQVNENIRLKVEELATALKHAGLWLKEEPGWVKEYQAGKIDDSFDFFQWLQFIYLPNRLMDIKPSLHGGNSGYITLQVKKFATEDQVNERIIQLLVELDGL